MFIVLSGRDPNFTQLKYGYQYAREGAALEQHLKHNKKLIKYLFLINTLTYLDLNRYYGVLYTPFYIYDQMEKPFSVPVRILIPNY